MRIPFLSKSSDEEASDPVCGMKIDVAKSGGGMYEYKGTKYYFCGPGCNRAFQKDPESYLSGEKKMSM